MEGSEACRMETARAGERSRRRDEAWLAALSEPELDFLISLRELAETRARNAGYPNLAEKFDLRTLRALGIVLLEFLKERLNNNSFDPKTVKALARLRDTGADSSDRTQSADLAIYEEDGAPSSGPEPRVKRMWDAVCEEGAQSRKKLKAAEKIK